MHVWIGGPSSKLRLLPRPPPFVVLVSMQCGATLQEYVGNKNTNLRSGSTGFDASTIPSFHLFVAQVSDTPVNIKPLFTDLQLDQHGKPQLTHMSKRGCSM